MNCLNWNNIEILGNNIQSLLIAQNIYFLIFIVVLNIILFWQILPYIVFSNVTEKSKNNRTN